MARVTPAVLVARLAAVPPAALTAGAASGSISAMNWAAWEYQIACGKRKLAWSGAIKKVAGSRRMIYDTRPASPYFRSGKMGQCEYKFMYGGSYTGRMGGGKGMAKVIVNMQATLNRMLAHQLDALAYGAMLHDGIWVRPRPPRWARGEIKLDYHERTTRWHMENMTGLGRLPSGTSLSVPGHSRREGNKSKRGWLSKTPRKSMA